MSDTGPIAPNPGAPIPPTNPSAPRVGVRRFVAALAAGVVSLGLALTLNPAPAQASWSQLTPGRIGFWQYSYAQGLFGAYRDPSDNGAWGNVLPTWLDYPRSIRNDSDRYHLWLYQNPSCMSAGGRWVGHLAPGDTMESTTLQGGAWRSIQAYSFLSPTTSQRSCRG